jgi:hypothetical protein
VRGTGRLWGTGYATGTRWAMGTGDRSAVAPVVQVPGDPGIGQSGLRSGECAEAGGERGRRGYPRRPSRSSTGTEVPDLRPDRRDSPDVRDYDVTPADAPCPWPIDFDAVAVAVFLAGFADGDPGQRPVRSRRSTISSSSISPVGSNPSAR